MTVQGEKYHHGRSPAGWTAVIIAGIGAVIGTVGFFMNIAWPVVIVGLVIMALAPIVGGTMSKMGYGQE
ncbi:hypothetical protein G7070_16750 [Propioniciclava coleopterorum]|uniref:Uncharacterized protein n=1 Tax=Propioniciclava coleopterorum TaxID=2714937 RepID=A0A6G7YAG7_9ACTN|nr:HGxxPAAW family protein [Propioniciclava coleopterorum]QIK73607.1 hypothetical protein G7070_16750 [Propioniciclava coleopterorum]